MISQLNSLFRFHTEYSANLIDNQVLQFVYSNRFTVKDPSDSVELLMTAHKLSLENLRKLCEICIRCFIELDTSVSDSTFEQAINAFQGEIFELIFKVTITHSCSI